MLPLPEAQSQVLTVAAPRTATVSLEDSLHHRLSDQIISPQYAPAFSNSAMDGYALSIAPEELGQAQITREVLGVIAAGNTTNAVLNTDTCVKIMTGAMVPETANAVVPIEQVTLLDDQRIALQGPFRQGQHIRQRGEEFTLGDTLLKKGHLIRPATVGLLASLGYVSVPVYHAPKVAILATGSELLPVGAPLTPGKLRDSNSETLAACVREAGAVPVKFGVLPDNPLAIQAAFEKAFASCDMVLSSGGVSVGDFDYVQDTLIKLGLEKKFWKVAIKPGKPVLFGTLADKLCFGIPGNPASALVVFELLVRPALKQMMGARQIFRPEARARLLQGVKPSPGRLHFMRAVYDSTKGTLEPFQGQGSSNLWSAARANALLPVHEAYEANQSVSCLLL